MSVFTTPDAPITTTGAVNNNLTGAIALAGGALAVAVVGGGVGLVGAFGAVGIGAFEIFTGGALLSGAAAHSAQKKLAAKPQPAKVKRSVPTPNITGREISSLRRGDF